MTIDYKAIDDLIDLMAERTLLSPVAPNLLKEGCDLMHAAGVSIRRVNLSWGTLHPTIAALSMKWWRDEPFEEVIRYYHTDDDSEWAKSPGYYCLENDGEEINAYLDNTTHDFPLFDEIREKGCTHYIINLVPFSKPDSGSHEKDGVLVSWASDRPGGFTQEEIKVIRRVQKHLGLALKMAVRERITLNTLNAYLGEKAAAKVITGTIKLGDGDVIPSVIWYSDLRNSTILGDTLSGPELLATLNEYFACTAGAVTDNGGEVLRFIGDAVLAIFPSDQTSLEYACEKATAAARDAIKRLEETNLKRQEEGKDSLSFGLGLHTGELMYGNIGIPERLDFAVTGPAANETARIEDMTKELSCMVLASSEFVSHSSEKWVSKGQFPLRGVERPVELFTLD